mmetsp:Transcript_74606/g.218730  ORF Transcript_74606/g.218730 Transcript_74606/m.218730 type:complete len:288 (+) Transcript_74606:552-1415(+)
MRLQLPWQRRPSRQLRHPGDLWPRMVRKDCREQQLQQPKKRLLPLRQLRLQRVRQGRLHEQTRLPEHLRPEHLKPPGHYQTPKCGRLHHRRRLPDQSLPVSLRLLGPQRQWPRRPHRHTRLSRCRRLHGNRVLLGRWKPCGHLRPLEHHLPEKLGLPRHHSTDGYGFLRVPWTQHNAHARREAARQALAESRQLMRWLPRWPAHPAQRTALAWHPLCCAWRQPRHARPPRPQLPAFRPRGLRGHEAPKQQRQLWCKRRHGRRRRWWAPPRRGRPPRAAPPRASPRGL